MRKAWQAQQVRLHGKPSWSKVVGPASAIIVQRKDFDWRWPAWRTFTTREGYVID